MTVKGLLDKDSGLFTAEVIANYMKNPIVLYNFDKDKPIGKTIKLEAIPGKGLVCEAQIDPEFAKAIDCDGFNKRTYGFG